MTYVEAVAAPLRKTGQIKLHGPEAFAGMRKAGRLAAECLDMLVEHARPGVDADEVGSWIRPSETDQHVGGTASDVEHAHARRERRDAR